MRRVEFKRIVLRHRDQLKAPYDALLDVMGFDALYEWSNMLGGTTIYVPRKEHMFINCLEKGIISEFDGVNYKELSRRFGLCERTVQKVVKKWKEDIMVG